MAIFNLAFLLVAVMFISESDKCKGVDGAGDELDVEYVFSIPYMYEDTGNWYEDSPPHVSMTTSSPVPVYISMTIPGYGYQVNYTITRDNPADVTLSVDEVGDDIRIYSDDDINNAHKKTIIVRASSAHISVCAIDNDYVGGDAFTIFPMSNIGSEYYVSSYSPSHTDDPSFLTISSSLPNTSINITRPFGATHRINLDRYQSYRYDGDDLEDLTGTFLQSNAPITVISGVFAEVPTDECCEDAMIEQLPPVSSWGYAFTLTPFLSLNSGHLYRVFTASHSVELQMSNGDKTRIAAQSFHEGNVTGDTVVSFTSDQPVMVVQYMKGYYANTPWRGDPSMVIVPPIAWFTTSATFYVFRYTEDHTYYVNVLIDCNHVDGLHLDGAPLKDISSPILPSPDGSMCCVRSEVSTGHHVVTSNSFSPFSVIVYAISSYSSYAFSVNTPRSAAVCPEDTTTHNTATQLTWPLTPASNESVFSLERCAVDTENRGQGLADRVCMRDDKLGAVWLDPIYLGCGEQDEPDLQELTQTDVVKSNAEDVATGLKKVTQEKANLTSEDVEDVADVLTNIGNAESDSPEVTSTIVEIADILVTTFAASHKEEDAEGDDDGVGVGEDTNVASFLNILEVIEEQVKRSTLNGQSFNTTTPSIAMVTTSADSKDSASGITFVVFATDYDKDDFRDEDIQTFGSEDDIPEDEEVRTSISLPSALFNTSTSSGSGSNGVSFVVHSSDLLFPTNSTNQNVRVGSDVISAIVVGVASVENLQEQVVIQFTVRESTSEPSCVFWDFDILDWSTDGCELQEYDNDRVTCHCNHLTNFAVLVEVSYDDTHFILDIVSKIGCVVSMVALLSTLVIFIAFRPLRIDNYGKNRVPRLILLNLCAALFLLYLVFLVGIDSTSDKGGCISVAFLLQCLTLASLCWMGVEAFTMYLKLVRLVRTEPPNFLLKASVAAWGLPLLITAISFGAGFDYYGHNEYCFVGTGPPLYYGLVLPIAIIVLHNLIMFSIITYRLSHRNVPGKMTQKSHSDEVRQRLKSAFAMSVLMGLTWVFGFLAIEDAKFVFSLIFCLCNSLQGLVLFLLFCVRQKDVRKHLRPYFLRLCGCFSTTQNETASTEATYSASTPKSPKSNVSTAEVSVTLPMLSTTADVENTRKDDEMVPTTSGSDIKNDDSPLMSPATMVDTNIDTDASVASQTIGR